jgi:hypothetical protein
VVPDDSEDERVTTMAKCHGGYYATEMHSRRPR